MREIPGRTVSGHEEDAQLDRSAWLFYFFIIFDKPEKVLNFISLPYMSASSMLKDLWYG